MVNATLNSTNSHYLATESFYYQHVLTFTLYTLTAITAIIGNVFVVSVIYKNGQKMRTSTFYLIANMALSDLAGGIAIVMQFLFCSSVLLDYSLGFQVACLFMKDMQILSYYVSTYSMAFIAYERYMLIVHPLTSSNATKIRIYLSISWLVGILFTSTCTFSMRVSEYFTPTDLISCRVLFRVETVPWFRKMRVVLLIVTQYFVPLAAVAVFYTLIALKIRNRYAMLVA